MAEPDELLTLQEACETLLRGLVKPATLTAAYKRGELTLEKLGRRHFVTPREIQDWRARCRRGPIGRDVGSNPTFAPDGTRSAYDELLRAADAMDWKGRPQTEPTPYEKALTTVQALRADLKKKPRSSRR